MAAKKQTKKLKRKAKQQSFIVLIASIVLIILGVGFVASPYISTLEGTIYNVNLTLDGDEVEVIGIGTEYKEEGATALFDYLNIELLTIDLTGGIDISYYDNNDTKVESIDTSSANTYYVKYTIVYKAVEKTIVKQINVYPNVNITFKDVDDTIYEVVTEVMTKTIDKIKNPVREGYHVAGWYELGDEDETLVKFPYTVTEDTTLIAKWAEGSASDSISFHFLEMGNDKAGDCIYIKAGDTDILIDAGSLQSSPATTAKYIDNYCTDNTLEYVIVTHADKDHIAGFVSTKDVKSMFERYECEIIIDFPQSDKTTTLYENYKAARDKEVEAGAIHYTALDCINEVKGAKRVYEIGEGLTMTVLDSYYYRNKSNDENNYSVCLLFSDIVNEKYFLLCGDLEGEGEEKLVELNDLPEVDLYKANHHGSKTSSSLELLEVIKPKIVTICCVSGSDEYTKYIDNIFPTTTAINNIAKYTDKIYVISQIDANGKAVSMNGNIVVSCIDGVVEVNCSNNNTILKDSEWFNRTVYYTVGKSGDTLATSNTAGAKQRPWRTWPSDGK